MSPVAFNEPKRAAGMTLVEIMVALVLSLFLIGGVINIFVISRHSYSLNDALARLQENGRFAVSDLQRTIRPTGHLGCVNIGNYEPQNRVSSGPSWLSFTPGDLLEGDDNVSSHSTGARDGTDVLSVKYGSMDMVEVANPVNPPSSDIEITNNAFGYEAGDYLLITDCSRADLFEVTSVGSASGNTTLGHDTSSNTTDGLASSYNDGFVMEFLRFQYYVADTGDDAEDGDPIYALYRNGDELVRGVEDMQVVYGVDTNSDGEVDDYGSAGAVNMENVITVEVSLLLRTQENVDTDDDTATYQVGDETVDPTDDRRIRKVVSTTISLRNRELQTNSI